MSNIIHATDASFEADVINSDIPVLVDFWAPWCGPCKSLAPILDSIATEYVGRLKVVKVDVDQNNATAAQFSVKGIPALILFKNGKVEATKIGYLPKSQLTTFIDSNL